MKTIKQIADEVGATKQALQKRLSREPLKTSLQPHISMVDGTKYIDEFGESLIKAAYGHIDNDVDKLVDAGIDAPIDRVDALLTLVAEQQKTIQDLTAANRELTSALENTTSSLKAAQALHAGTMQTHLLTDGQEKEKEKPVGFFRGLFKRKKD